VQRFLSSLRYRTKDYDIVQLVYLVHLAGGIERCDNKLAGGASSEREPPLNVDLLCLAGVERIEGDSLQKRIVSVCNMVTGKEYS
jgi:hypothetical protein